MSDGEIYDKLAASSSGTDVLTHVLELVVYIQSHTYICLNMLSNLLNQALDSS